MSPLFLGPHRSTRRSKTSRFHRSRHLGEEFASKIVQGSVGLVLCGGLIWLFLSAVQLIRAHFLANYGPQAWLLPIVIGFIFLFVLHRVLRVWRQALVLRREMQEAREALRREDEEAGGDSAQP